MKRGGQEIYVGPLGRHSSHLIKYFEVRCNLNLILFIENTITIILLGKLFSNVFNCPEY